MPGQVQANDIKNSLGAGDSPADIIRNSIRKPAEVPVVPDVPAAIAAGEPVVEVKPPESKPFEVPPPPAPKTPETPKPLVEAKPPVDEDITDPFGKKDKASSWKDLRTKVTKAEQRAQELENEKLELSKKLEGYDNGEVVPTYVEDLKSKTKELERYRDLYDLESSPEYIETYIEPQQKIREELKPTLEEFNVPLGEIEKLASMTSEREVNNFIGKHFDTLTGFKIKAKVDELKTLKANEGFARNHPKEYREELVRNATKAREEQDRQRLGRIDTSARTSWINAVKELQAEGTYPEITYRGDPDHDRYVQETLERAAKEYGIFVKWAAASGAKDFPVEIGTIMAKRFALSDSAMIMAHSREQVWNEHTKMVADAKTTDYYDHPPLGGGFNKIPAGGNSSTPKGPDSPAAAGDAILRKIGL